MNGETMKQIFEANDNGQRFNNPAACERGSELYDQLAAQYGRETRKYMAYSSQRMLSGKSHEEAVVFVEKSF